MDVEAKKADLNSRYRAERAGLEELFAEVGPQRMEVSGVEGEWAVKDIIYHIALYEQVVLNRFEAALTGEPLRPSPIPDGEIDPRNAVIFQRNHERPLAEVQAEAQQIYEAILAALDKLPADALYDPQRFDWMEGYPLADVLEGNGIEHYHEHIPQIRAWLAKQEGGSADG